VVNKIHKKRGEQIMSKHNKVEDYIADLEGRQEQMAKELDRMICEAAPDARKVMKMLALSVNA
jgi:hypothetical protein